MTLWIVWGSCDNSNDSYSEWIVSICLTKSLANSVFNKCKPFDGGEYNTRYRIQEVSTLADPFIHPYV